MLSARRSLRGQLRNDLLALLLLGFLPLLVLAGADSLHATAELLLGDRIARLLDDLLAKRCQSFVPLVGDGVSLHPAHWDEPEQRARDRELPEVNVLLVDAVLLSAAGGVRPVTTLELVRGIGVLGHRIAELGKHGLGGRIE